MCSSSLCVTVVLEVYFIFWCISSFGVFHLFVLLVYFFVHVVFLIVEKAVESVFHQRRSWKSRGECCPNSQITQGDTMVQKLDQQRRDEKNKQHACLFFASDPPDVPPPHPPGPSFEAPPAVREYNLSCHPQSFGSVVLDEKTPPPCRDSPGPLFIRIQKAATRHQMA